MYSFSRFKENPFKAIVKWRRREIKETRYELTNDGQLTDTEHISRSFSHNVNCTYLYIWVISHPRFVTANFGFSMTDLSNLRSSILLLLCWTTFYLVQFSGERTSIPLSSERKAGATYHQTCMSKRVSHNQQREFKVCAHAPFKLTFARRSLTTPIAIDRQNVLGYSPCQRPSNPGIESALCRHFHWDVIFFQ